MSIPPPLTIPNAVRPPQCPLFSDTYRLIIKNIPRKGKKKNTPSKLEANPDQNIVRKNKNMLRTLFKYILSIKPLYSIPRTFSIQTILACFQRFLLFRLETNPLLCTCSIALKKCMIR